MKTKEKIRRELKKLLSNKELAIDFNQFIEKNDEDVVDDAVYKTIAILEECDFALEVSSPGVGSNLTMPRQFVKNVGRTLEATLSDKVMEGEIVEADEEGVTIFWEAREPKPVGKGKITVEHEEKINYADIKKAIIKVTF